MIVSTLKLILLTAITVFFAALAIFLLPINRQGRAFHWCATTWAHFVLRVASVHVRVKGLGHLGVGRNYIYAANHASYFDIPAILATLPGQVRIVFKKELARIPVFGWAMKFGSYISIDRGDGRYAMESLEKAAREIREGSAVLLFPEGTRSQDGRLQSFKRGAFALAVRSRVPIVPVTVNGSYSILPRNKFRVNSGTIEIIIHPAVATNGWNGKEGELQLMEKVRSTIASGYLEPVKT